MYKHQVLWILSLILVILICDLYNIHIFQKEGIDSLDLENMWTDNKNAIYIFEQIFQNTDKKVVIYSSLKSPPALTDREPNTVYVQYSGESYYHDPKLFDINIIPTDKITKVIK